MPELTDSQSNVILFFKKNAEAQARQKKMMEHTHMEDQHNNAENAGKDSLPQESSTPKNYEKDNGKYYTRHFITSLHSVYIEENQYRTPHPGAFQGRPMEANIVKEHDMVKNLH